MSIRILPKFVSDNVGKVVGKGIDKVASTGLLKNMAKNYRHNNIKYIAGVSVISIILKDGLGCYLYVKQSLNNKKIPEEKRKFVAALDLANGGLMILAQLAAAVTISNEKIQQKLFDKFYSKFTDRASRKGHNLKMKGLGKIYSNKEFNTVFSELKKTSAATFGVVTSLIAATIFAKRVLVPFIATPLAEKAKKFLYSSETPKETENIQNGTDNFKKAETENNNAAKIGSEDSFVTTKKNKQKFTSSNLIKNYESNIQNH